MFGRMYGVNSLLLKAEFFSEIFACLGFYGAVVGTLPRRFCMAYPFHVESSSSFLRLSSWLRRNVSKEVTTNAA